jgi:excinuclease ABC subunit A
MTAEPLQRRTADLPDLPSPGKRTHLRIEGARQHNLADLTVELPKRKLIVFTGVSGSGKSSLAFDTIYAEGRRRYVESLSTYARQFLGQMEKAEFDRITGLSPTISIEQKTTGTNPRSTVGTVTEVYDHLRVLFANLGTQHCYNCGRPVTSMSRGAIADQILELEDGTKFMLLAPLVRNRKGEFADLFDDLREQGFVRARIDGEIELLETIDKLDLHAKHDIDVVVDRLVARDKDRPRIEESLDLALQTGEGSALLHVPEGELDDDEPSERLFSTDKACTHCNIAFPELTHQSFSFNSPVGQCSRCDGIGTTPQVDGDLLVIDVNQSVADGALEPIGPDPATEAGEDFKYNAYNDQIWDDVHTIADARDIDLETPWRSLDDEAQRALIDGIPDADGESVDGVAAFVDEMRTGADTSSDRNFFKEFVTPSPCPECDGTRLRPESRAVRFRDTSIADICEASIVDAADFFAEIELDGLEATIGRDLLTEIRSHLSFLQDVGLDYLTLNRAAQSLSGGESQRVRLASQLGSELSGLLYVLDEPSIGLHQRDNKQLLQTLERLRDDGNTVIVVEHDRETMEHADHLVDFGPGAGDGGGEIVGQGTLEDVKAAERSVTGDYLADRKSIEVPDERRQGSGESFTISGATHNNLRDIDVDFPCRQFICVTGVSGAGKSSLVNDILYPAVARHVYYKHRSVGPHDDIDGLELFDKVIEIDQSPIGKTPRSTAATYTKVFDHVRKLFANLPTSEMYGFDKGRFSFNTDGGRCSECGGQGAQKVEMNFLADVYVPCEACLGRRYDETTLRVKYRGHNIADILDMTIGEAADLFERHRKISRILDTLLDVGLDYIKLGQPSPTLSGGEAQRVKLASELAKIATGDTLYILDEPSTGLHLDDINNLLDVINQLVDAGNTVVVIEHDLEIAKCADHIIDLGPGGGDTGGHLVATGTPEEVADSPDSVTGEFLSELL